MSLRVYLEESSFKVAECIYHHVFIRRKVVLKLQNIYISLGVHQEESYYKNAQCICHHVFMW